jgi:glycosyltransferase involved in cell wall biosynthesis
MSQYRAEGLEIVRYSPREANLEPTAGCDKIIRFYKDENEFGHWVGAGNEVITFAQDMKHRGEFCNYDAFVEIAQGFNAHVYGPKNEVSGELNGGFMTYQEMQQKLRDARVYIYTGTQPASYVLNLVEAMMTGVPVIALGPEHANSLNRKNRINADLYEVPDIIQNGVNGFVTDDIAKAREYVQLLLNDLKLARRIGDMGRQRAIELFGKDIIKAKWKEFLKV